MTQSVLSTKLPPPCRLGPISARMASQSASAPPRSEPLPVRVVTDGAEAIQLLSMTLVRCDGCQGVFCVWLYSILLATMCAPLPPLTSQLSDTERSVHQAATPVPARANKCTNGFAECIRPTQKRAITCASCDRWRRGHTAAIYDARSM